MYCETVLSIVLVTTFSALSPSSNGSSGEASKKVELPRVQMEARAILTNGFVVHGQLRSLTPTEVKIRNYRLRSGRVRTYRAADILRIDVLGDIYEYSEKEGGFLSFRRTQPKHCELVDAYKSLLAPERRGRITTIDPTSARFTLSPGYRFLYVLLRLDGRGERCDFSNSVVTDVEQNTVGTVYAWVDGLTVRCRRPSEEYVINPILKRLKDRAAVQKCVEFSSGRLFDDRRNVLLILETDESWNLQSDLFLDVAGFRLPLRTSPRNMKRWIHPVSVEGSNNPRRPIRRPPSFDRRLKGF